MVTAAMMAIVTLCSVRLWLRPTRVSVSVHVLRLNEAHYAAGDLMLIAAEVHDIAFHPATRAAYASNLPLSALLRLGFDSDGLLSSVERSWMLRQMRRIH